MKKYTVYTYYYPIDEHNDREMYLGYTSYDRPSQHQKIYQVEAETRSKAITKAINLRKSEKEKAKAKVWEEIGK